MHHFSEILKNLKTSKSDLNNDLFKGVLESLIDGVVIFTATGKLVHASTSAHQILAPFLTIDRCAKQLRQELDRLCKAVVESADLYADRAVVVESELSDSAAGAIRIRVRWLRLSAYDAPLLLMSVEDQKQSMQAKALSEASKYELTHREAEVWSLRHYNFSYQEIATRLFISVNTVKKHLKNIRIKVDNYQFGQEC
ncbi:MAG: LuxR C-terminal-related transcriptional regulator [Cyanobacteria bacterium P01_A01_bin.114]